MTIYQHTARIIHINQFGTWVWAWVWAKGVACMLKGCKGLEGCKT